MFSLAAAQDIINSRHYVSIFTFSITLSLGEKPISVEARMKNGERVRIHMQVLDRHDGSYIVRYKVYSNVPSMLVDVTFNGRHVADSPYVLDGEW